MFSTQTIAALAVGVVLALAVPVAAVIVFKRKNRDTWLPSVFIGAGTFIVFALVLEQLLHLVMLPIVQKNQWVYAVYGALAAGVFEETGRLVAYKTLMKKHYTTKNSVLMGLGHGGVEAMIVLGGSFLMYLVMAVMANGYGGIEAFMEAMKGNAPDNINDNMRSILVTVEQVGFANVFASLYERVIAMVLHTCLSVWVYKAATHKMWLYPAAIGAHALIDFFAALYQVGVITSVPLLYVIMTVFDAAAVFATVKLTKKYPDKAR